MSATASRIFEYNRIPDMPRVPRKKCAFAVSDVPKIQKARAAPVKLTPEEREEKKALARARADAREKKKLWEANLQPWMPPTDSHRGVQFAILTKVRYAPRTADLPYSFMTI